MEPQPPKVFSPPPPPERTLAPIGERWRQPERGWDGCRGAEGSRDWVRLQIDSTIGQLRGPRLQAALAALPEWRRAEALAYKFESGQAQSAAAYLLLCRLLREHYGITEQPRFIIGEHGKPELDLTAAGPLPAPPLGGGGGGGASALSGHSPKGGAGRGPVGAGPVGLFFNLSHCTEAVAAVVAEEPVGVDIEMRGRYTPSLAEYVCSPAELREIEAVPEERDLRFTTLWTQKESALKLLGTGLTDGEELKRILATDRFLFETQVFPHFVCTVATLNAKQ